MPFNHRRNSRDDNSKKQRSNSESFKSKSGHSNKRTNNRNTDSRGSSFEKPSFGRDDKKPFDRYADRGEKRSFGRDDKKPFDRYADRGEKKSFGRDDKKPFDRYADRGEKRSFGRDDKKPFDRYADRGEKRSFGRDDKKPFDRYADRGEKKSFGRDDKKPFDRYADRGEKRSFGRDDKKPFDRYADRGEKRSFDRSDDRTYKKDFDQTSRTSSPRRSRDREETSNEFKYGGKRKFAAAKSPATGFMKDNGLIRLNRYIANSGVCSRRKADELIEAGVISVNGEVITELGAKVDPAKDEVRYNNERLKREKMVYVLLNKPKDYITTTDDPQERHTVMHLVEKATSERIYPVGRLDRNTTGLLLLTNDGNLAEKLSHPRNNISKMYHVELNRNLTQGDFNKIEFGLELEDGVVKPDDLSYIQGGSKREVGIQIHSGKNRIVRRIFESLGYDVVKLDRVVYANLTKKDLPRGRWRYLEERELIQLKHFTK